MTKELARDLLLRQLGLKHKLKVYDSVKQPETHDETASTLLARWELEDEISAIDQILAELRKSKVTAKKSQIEKDLSIRKSVMKKKSK